MYLLKLKLRDALYRYGVICLVLSLIFFCLPFFVTVKEENLTGLFLLNFSMTWIYFISLLVYRRTAVPENKIHHSFLFLNLFLISAYALNREMNVFEDSVNWFSVLLVTSCINYSAFAFAEKFPRWVIHVMSFISGISWMVFAYLALYLFPIYAFGVAGSFILGVGAHAFVPLFFTIYSIILMNKTTQANKRYWLSFLSGLLTAITIIIFYAISWDNTKLKIDGAWYDSYKTRNDLPTWINVAEKIPDNDFSRKLLRTDLVYSIPHEGRGDFFWSMPARNIGEAKKHDPLVMTSEFFTGKFHLENADKIKILQSLYQLKHETQDRLWSRDHLSTENVNTEIKFWPDCNLTYTEKTITVSNNNTLRWGRTEEEALYTFYMPEGAVVTSLSLWINGKEEKSILTTKEKADVAYKTIVGRERRDPSVAHWQEGNSVSVRVFPVMNGESRKFKIGITAPLERVNGKLLYENIYFKGPFYDDAKESILIDFEQPVSDFQIPASFTSMSRQSYQRKGNYKPFWSMAIRDPGLSNCSFSFDDNTYSLSPYHKKLSASNFEKIYLDINSAWKKDELNKILELTKDKQVYVYDSIIKRLDEGNEDKLWENLHEKQFSLFPIYEIDQPNKSLLITKSKIISPCMDDLEATPFMEKTKLFLQKEQKINLFDLGADLSPYLKSLKEFRIFQYDKGDINQLQEIFQKNYFPEDIENDEQVIIHQSDMIIRKTKGAQPVSGPDHLMRLFAYNHIMQKLGSGQLTGREENNDLVEEARKAYVVTPVSSLVVLETQKDYDRFDIKDTHTSLQNASLQSNGAAPEPHEWAIIIIVLLFFAFIIRRYKLRYN